MPRLSIALATVLLASFTVRGHSQDLDPKTVHQIETLVNDFAGATDKAALERIRSSLLAIGPRALPVLRRLTGTRGRQSYMAGWAMVMFGEEGTRELARGLADSSTTVVSHTILTMADPDSIHLLPVMEPLLHDTNPQLRAEAVSVIGENGSYSGPSSEQPEIMALLRSAMQDPALVVRQAAMEGIASRSDLDQLTMDAVITALRDPDPDIRTNAIISAGRIGPSAGAAVPVLIEYAQDGTHRDLQLRSLSALADLAEIARPAVPALVRLAAGKDEEVRIAALEALGAIGVAGVAEKDRTAVLSTMAAALNASSLEVALAGVRSLHELGEAGAPHLVEALLSHRDSVASEAAQALAGMHQSPERAAALLNALPRATPGARNAIVDALGAFGSSVFPELDRIEPTADAVTRKAIMRVRDYVAAATRVPVTAGCYEIVRKAWGPRADIGGDSIFTTPPGFVRFSLIKATEYPSAEEITMIVLPARGTEDGPDGPGQWNPVKGQNAISVVYSNGFSGMSMALRVEGDSLVGTASTFWDFPRDQQKAAVVLRPVSCEWPADR